jgi:Ca2+-transporting ATPase
MTLPGWHKKTAAQVLEDLKTSGKGLSSSEAATRLIRYGPNELREEKGPGPVSIFLNQFKSFLIAILIAATIFSALIYEFIQSLAIIIIVILNAVFGFIQEYKAERTMAALKKMTAQQAIVIRNGKETRIPSRLLVPGDIVLIEQGSRIPADMRLIEVVDIKMDEAALTGESTPVNKVTSPVEKSALADITNMAWAGTTVTYGRGRGVVTDTGMSTQVGKIAHIVQEAREELTPLQKKLDSFGKRLGLLILGICVVVIVIGLFRMVIFAESLSPEKFTGDILFIVMIGIALAVAAIPEGLPAVVTITLTLGLQKLSKHNALIRKLPAVEALGSTTVICSDKTGTLTKNEMTVTRIWHSGKTVEVTGRGYSPSGKFLFKGKPIHPTMDTTLKSILQSGALCSNASLVKEKGSWSVMGDPTEGSLVVAASKAGLTPEKLSRHERIREFPFSSERKMMSVACQIGGTVLHAKGAPETILSLSTHMVKNGRRVSLTKKDRKAILNANHEMTNRALRVLAIATRTVQASASQKQAESDLTFLGLVGMIDPPREGVRRDIELCRRAGIKVVMITGDHKNTAVAIARQLNINEGNIMALTGEELGRLSDKGLGSIINEVSVYARVNPEHKVRIVDALKKKGHIIAMTGDGVNDAPALKKADIGVAMGIKGTDVAKEASDMILRDDNFSSIVMAVKGGRAIYDNIKKFIQYLLSSNMGEVLVVFLAILIGFTDPSDPTKIIIPVTAIQLLWINLLTDGLPALALGVDPPTPNIMERLPRSTRERILSRSMLTDIWIVGVIICIGTLFLFWLNLSAGGEGVARKAVTVAFTTIVMFEMVRVQSVRLKYRIGIFSNKKLLLAMAVSILLQLLVIYTPVLQPVFSTTALGLTEWLEIVAVSSTVLVIMWLKDRFFRPEI